MIPLSEWLKRLPAEAKEEAALITAALAIPTNLKEKATEIRSNTRLSPVGQAEEIKKVAMGNPLAHLKQIKSRVESMNADVANLKAGMKPKQPDSTDIRGELMRAELRAFVRALPQAEKLRTVLEDEVITEAVLLGHPSLSGLSTKSEKGAPSQFDLVREKYLDAKFGPQLRGIEAREEVLETLTTAVDIATREFRRESGLSENEIA